MEKNISNLRKILANNIRNHRARLKISQEKLAEICRSLPNIPKKSITCKLSLNKKFVRDENSFWKVLILF